jgi:hypothetical protein
MLQEKLLDILLLVSKAKQKEDRKMVQVQTWVWEYLITGAMSALILKAILICSLEASIFYEARGHLSRGQLIDSGGSLNVFLLSH